MLYVRGRVEKGEEERCFPPQPQYFPERTIIVWIIKGFLPTHFLLAIIRPVLSLAATTNFGNLFLPWVDRDTGPGSDSELPLQIRNLFASTDQFGF